MSAYSKQTWDTNSYVNPTRMNHIEDGIEEADTVARAAASAAATAATAAGTSYDNTSSGLSATDTQGAIDELAGRDLSFSTIVSPIQVTSNTNVTFTLNSGNFIDYKALAVALYDGTYVRANTLLTRNPSSISFDGIVIGWYSGNPFVAVLKQSTDNTGVINHNCPTDLNLVIRAFK